jgi:hypothetical protein
MEYLDPNSSKPTLNDKTSFCPAMVRVEYETILYIPNAPTDVLIKKEKGIVQTSVVLLRKLPTEQVIPINTLMMEEMRHRLLVPSSNCRLVTLWNKPCKKNKHLTKAISNYKIEKP